MGNTALEGQRESGHRITIEQFKTTIEAIKKALEGSLEITEGLNEDSLPEDLAPTTDKICEWLNQMDTEIGDAITSAGVVLGLIEKK